MQSVLDRIERVSPASHERSGRFASIDGPLGDVLSEWGLKEAVANHLLGNKITELWADAAGLALSKGTEHLAWDQNVLTASIESSTLRHEASLKSRQIAQELNTLIGFDAVARIEVRAWPAQSSQTTTNRHIAKNKG